MKGEGGEGGGERETVRGVIEWSCPPPTPLLRRISATHILLLLLLLANADAAAADARAVLVLLRGAAAYWCPPRRRMRVACAGTLTTERKQTYLGEHGAQGCRMTAKEESHASELLGLTDLHMSGKESRTVSSFILVCATPLYTLITLV